MTRDNPLFPQLVLVFVTLLWGSTFLTLQIALQWADAVVIVALRFALAALFYIGFLRSNIFHIHRRDWFAGLLTGGCIYAVYYLQTLGLATIPSSTSAFLTGLYVAFVPLLQWVVMRRTPNKSVLVGVALAFTGMTLLANPFTMEFSNNWGEWITIISAFICAIEILLVGKFAPRCVPLHLGFIQMLTVTGLAFITYILNPPVRETEFCLGLWIAVGALAAIVAFIQFVIGWALKTVDALRATMIYSLEPVFAGIIGWLAGERLGMMGLTGGALIVIAVLVSSWCPKSSSS